ncbi:MAG: transketolase [Alphaproteobacteria bacterium]|nr:transketolase [Alphaproteobacteria bacterium]
MSQTALKTSPETADLRRYANAIRVLAMDAVEKAKSGHPGMPMGMADVATVLYTKFLKFDARKPDWFDRDRFILSAGHGSMLLYALNYLLGYEKMTLDELKNFRQLGAITAGHPEVNVAAGIEMTTGPLGQGISTAVGFALAERILNQNHHTYVIASDGDMMEGISHEACSLAGHLKLGKLIVLYDDNGISIDGSTALSFTEDVCKRFDAYGWATSKIDGHNFAEIEAALTKAQNSDKPVLIACKTHIGYGAPTKQGSASSHGSPLGTDEIAGTRKNYLWDHAPFEVPEDILAFWRAAGTRTTATANPKDTTASWQNPINQAKEFFAKEKPKMATRATSGKVLEFLVPALDNLIGGSADLTGSVNTKVKGPEAISAANNYKGQYIHYGVREHGMAAIMNGMALHGGIIPYSGTFLSFADYCRPSLRLAALMKQRVIHVMTHDSIGLGEDGPTHQPVEHLASLRAIPNLYVFRPCDGIETAESWDCALKLDNAPSVLSLTRQNLQTIREDIAENKTARGAYVLYECPAEPDVTIFATGSEVSIAMEAGKKLGAQGFKVRLVSVPCLDLFWKQDYEYQKSILCNQSLKVAVEAGIRQCWDGMIGQPGLFFGVETFGESAPYEKLYEHFGLTAENIANKVSEHLKKK